MHRSIFLRQLSYWTFHCSLNALPSFGIALFGLGLWRNPAAITAMLLAIGTFILFYSMLTSLPGPLLEPDHLLSRALRVGIKVRGWISLLSVPLILMKGFAVTPDFWCGVLSSAIFNYAAELLGTQGRLVGSAMPPGFLEVFTVTLLEGFMLSLIILAVALIAVVVLKVLGRLNPYAAADPH